MKIVTLSETLSIDYMKYKIEGSFTIIGLDLRSKDEVDEIKAELEEWFEDVRKDSGYEVYFSFD